MLEWAQWFGAASGERVEEEREAVMMTVTAAPSHPSQLLLNWAGKCKTAIKQNLHVRTYLCRIADDLWQVRPVAEQTARQQPLLPLTGAKTPVVGRADADWLEHDRTGKKTSTVSPWLYLQFILDTSQGASRGEHTSAACRSFFSPTVSYPSISSPY